MRRRPYQVILFDEVEKAHPDVFNVLLQVLDDGRLTDGQGRTVDFRNTLIVLTSNLGSDALANLPDGADIEQARPQVMNAVRAAFRPEFLNRLDEILLFRRLSRDDMKGIVEIQLERLKKLLTDRKISLDIAPEVSSIDPSASIQVSSGISIPAFIVRRARTSVDLKNGQSFMIAGLLQSQNDITTSRVPGIGKLPVLGPLFSSKSYQRRETDLVIIVTPYLVKPVDPSKKMVEPTDGTQPASAADYFLNNTEEVDASAPKRPVALADGSATRPVAATTAGHFLDLPKD